MHREDVPVDDEETNAAKADLTRLNRVAPLGLSLVCVLDGAPGGGEVVALGRDGKVRWKIAVPERPADACLLPGGRVLIAEHDGKRVRETRLEVDFLGGASVLPSSQATASCPSRAS